MMIDFFHSAFSFCLYVLILFSNLSEQIYKFTEKPHLPGGSGVINKRNVSLLKVTSHFTEKPLCLINCYSSVNEANPALPGPT